MSFLVPAGLALGLSIPVVVAMYLLKVRRRDQQVASTYLWSDVIRDLAAHEPLQKLKWNVLLALQVLGLLALTLAFARPFIQREGEPAVRAIFILDASASMQATDVAPSRFAQAVQQAQHALDLLPGGSVTTVILAAAHPAVLVSASADRAAVGDALATAAPTGGKSDEREALLLARSLGGALTNRRIAFFTDGAFNPPSDLPDDLGPLEIVRVGNPNAGNLAITALAARADPADSSRSQLFARIENLSSVQADTTLTLSADDQAVEQRSVSLEPDGQSDQTFETIPAEARVASVAISAVPGEDNLSLDDAAYVVLAPHKPSEVLLVSPGNPYLEKVLSLLPNVDLYRVTAERYLDVEADRFDVVVFDSYVPPVLPRGNLLIVNPPDNAPLPLVGVVQQPRVGAWVANDPIMAYVNIQDLTVRSARKLDPSQGMTALVSTPDGVPLLATSDQGGHRTAIIPFDLGQSNLPLSPAFPILMSNLFGYLAPAGVVQTPTIQTGAVESLAPLPQVDAVLVTDPAGTVTQLRPHSGPLAFTQTNLPGVYRVQQTVAGGADTVQDDLFTANLLDRDASDLRDRLTGLGDAGTTEEAPAVGVPTEVWAVLAALVLPLLMVEWYWFQRR